MDNSKIKDEKVKEEKFKPRKLTPAEKRELKRLGIGKTKPFDIQPVFEEKTVTTSGCQVCDTLFLEARAPVSVCFRCGNCVYCGAYNDDRYSNYCFTCGNGGPRLDSL